MRIDVRVQPRAGRAAVGGTRDGALLVKVAEAAVDGKATEAALGALAEALGLPRRRLRLITGARSRHKVVEVEGDDDALADRLRELRAGTTDR